MTKKLAARYSHQVSALLTAYRLLDLELLHYGPEHPITLPPSHPNSITPSMLETPKVKDRWRKLNNWQELLIDFRNCYHNELSLQVQDLVSVDESPLRGSLSHLQGLADSYSSQEFASVVQNFRGAALHLTFLHEITDLNTHELPSIPENVSTIINRDILRQLHEMYQPHTLAKMDSYLRKHSQGELVLPLHLSMLLTPCFLLMSSTLVKSKFPRESIYQVRIP